MLELGIHTLRVVKFNYQSDMSTLEQIRPYYHFIYVISGTGELIMAGNHHHLSKGNLYFIPMLTNRTMHLKKSLKIINIKFKCNEASEPILNKFAHCISDLNLHQENMIWNILNEAMTSTSYFEEIINIRVAELIISILRKTENSFVKLLGYSSEVTCAQKKYSNTDMEEVLIYIRNNIESHIGISDLAHRFRYSESYFCTRFKKVYGISPNKYINKVKMEKAKDLLLYSRLNISEISERLGYESTNYFSRLFKMTTTYSPQNYINRLNDEFEVEFLLESNNDSAS